MPGEKISVWVGIMPGTMTDFPVSLRKTDCIQKGDAHLGGLNVPLKVLLSISGSSTAYGPPSSTSTSRNCVSGGKSAAVLPHSGVIHHNLHLAHARHRFDFSCSTVLNCAISSDTTLLVMSHACSSL